MCPSSDHHRPVIGTVGRDSAGRGWSWAAAVVLALASVACSAQPPAAEPKAPTPRQLAAGYLQLGNLLHRFGQFEQAAEAFRASIAALPTAEGHTFLGWSLSYLGRIEEAIRECEIAIGLDPDFGNPYNDIGVYLIALGRSAESPPWFEKAIAAKRYCCYQFPHANLGRVLLESGRIDEARRSFERALTYDPAYLPALAGLEAIRRLGLQAL